MLNIFNFIGYTIATKGGIKMKKEISQREKQLGRLIRRLRKLRGLTGEELGEIVGVTKSAVSRWESGEVANIGLENLNKLVEAIGIDGSLFVFKNKDLSAAYIKAVSNELGIDATLLSEDEIDRHIAEFLKEKKHNKKAAD